MRGANKVDGINVARFGIQTETQVVTVPVCSLADGRRRREEETKKREKQSSSGTMPKQKEGTHRLPPKGGFMTQLHVPSNSREVGGERIK